MTGASIGSRRGRKLVARRTDAGDAVRAQEDGHGEGGYGGVYGLVDRLDFGIKWLVGWAGLG